MPDTVTPTTPVSPLPNPQEVVDKALENKPTEEMPLAFATPSPAVPTPTPEPAPAAPALMPTPTPTPTPLPPTPEKPAKKKGKVGVVVGGMLLLLMVLFGGVYAYSLISGQPMIAVIVNDGGGGGTTTKKTPAPKTVPKDERGDAPAKTPTPTKAPTTPTRTPTPTKAPTIDPGRFGYNYDTGKAATDSDWNNPAANIAGTYIAPNGERYIIAIPSTQEAAVKYNIETGGALQGKIGINDTVSTTDKVVWPDITLEQFNAEKAAGRTWVPPGTGCYETTVKGTPEDAAAQAACNTWHWTTCLNKGTGVDGVGCDVVTKKTGGGTATFIPPNEVIAPTMSCDGITRSTPTVTPAVGDKLTFTCAGTVTPSTAGTLTYKFRYSLNSGAFVELTNKTATTAELTISACGTYKVQCQACATLSGVLTCSPTWTGATQ